MSNQMDHDTATLIHRKQRMVNLTKPLHFAGRRGSWGTPSVKGLIARGYLRRSSRLIRRRNARRCTLSQLARSRPSRSPWTMDMAASRIELTSIWSKLKVGQLWASRLINVLALTAIFCWCHQILTQIWWRQRGSHLNNVVGRPVSSRPSKLTEGVLSFRKIRHLPPTQRNSRCNRQSATTVSLFWCGVIWHARTAKRRREIKRGR